MREYKQLTALEIDFLYSCGDKFLTRKQKQVNNIIKAPYRKGLNYCKLMDIRLCIADALFNNSLNRVLSA